MRPWILASLLAAGCLSQPETDTVDQEVNGPPPTAFANDQAAFDFFVGKGLTNFQAAGIVGNLDQESGVNPNSVQSGGPGRGIAQWSVGGRWDTSNPNVVAYAAAQNEGVHTLNLQLEFIWHELTTVGYGYTQLQATTNVTDATITFMDRYEICGTCASSQRVAYAMSVLNAYGQIDWGAHYVSQSWPLATTAMTIHCGESIPATLVMKNIGTKTWNGSTRLATTQPRDRDSIFAGPDWIAPNRAASSGTVAPGSNGTFSFTFDGPTGDACVPGMYTEYFGIVQDGTHWFSDNGEGGPADDQLEALIQLVAGDDAGSGSGSGSGDTGSGSGSGSDDGSDRDGSDGGPGTESAGCAAGGAGAGGFGFAALGALGLVARRRVRRP
ncbi:MAG TPA: phage tail tip lysozyme [Kofleriaceae bacterium]|jgi:hypothetical protein